jgi:hypothetical protein
VAVGFRSGLYLGLATAMCEGVGQAAYAMHASFLPFSCVIPLFHAFLTCLLTSIPGYLTMLYSCLSFFFAPSFLLLLPYLLYD